jgi:kinesin family protein 2/24
MIATLSPGSSSADHTVNTLRYADRIKENVVGDAWKSPTKPKKSPARSIASMKQPTPKSSDVRDEYDELDQILDGDDDEDAYTSTESEKFSELDQTVQNLYDEQEKLLNLHMNIIHENAELLMKENVLLSSVQGDDYDVDEYAAKLSEIIDRKTEMVQDLKDSLLSFQEQLKKEEELSKNRRR